MKRRFFVLLLVLIPIFVLLGVWIKREKFFSGEWSQSSIVKMKFGTTPHVLPSGTGSPADQTASQVGGAVGPPGAISQLTQSPSSAEEAESTSEEGDAVDPQAYRKAPPLTRQEVANVRALLSTFFQPGRGKSGLNRFLRQLEAAGLAPQLAKDSNAYTGNMLIVRTKEALQGTRYLHAQYFEDDSRNKEPFRQHLSFEIRPSPDSLQVVQALVRELSGNKLGAPVGSRGDEWIEWKLGNHSVWAHRLGKDDIAYDPFNARSKEDMGTMRVAIELIQDRGHEKSH